MPSNTSKRSVGRSGRSPRRASGTAAIARTPWGVSVSAAVAKSFSLTASCATARSSIEATSDAPRGVSTRRGLLITPLIAMDVRSSSSTPLTPSTTNRPCRSLALRRCRSRASVRIFMSGICFAFPRSGSGWLRDSTGLETMRRFAAGAAMDAMVVSAAGCGISQRQEVELGASQAQQVNAQLPIVQDPTINRYLNTLGDSLARLTSRGDLDWHFYMVNTSEFNAFALPGGFIYVNRGVAERSDRLDQFASVIAHEIGHVVLRHSVKQMEQMQGANVGAGVLCALTSVCNSGLGQAGIQIAGSAIFAKFSREDEAQADAAGVDEMVRAGINPNGMPEMFEKLLAERQTQPGALDAWFAD